MRLYCLIISIFCLSVACGSHKNVATPGNNNTNNSQQSTNSPKNTTNTAALGAAETDKYVGSYTAQDQCNGDFTYNVTIKKGREANELLLLGVGSMGDEVILSAQMLDAMQLEIGETATNDMQIKVNGKAVRDKATGIISFSYTMSGGDGDYNDCYVSLIPK